MNLGMKPDLQIKIFDKYISRNKLSGYHDVDWPDDTGIAVIVPVYLEEDYIDACLKSLIASGKIQTTITVLLVVNTSERDNPGIVKRQEALYDRLKEEVRNMSVPGMHFIVLKNFGIRWKHAGVGAARKTGMDFAVWGFRNSGNPDGIIVSLDADTVVASDYFKEIESFFKNMKLSGCSIRFEHRLDDVKEDNELSAIVQYELYLRYYRQALVFTGAPFAFHTVGSAFALRAVSYVRAGGMPRKQAGEDFYLIQKVVQMGGWDELNTTCVYPSSRPSDRVPFGTGPVVRKLMSDDSVYETYTPEAFYALKKLFDSRTSLYRIPGNEYNLFINGLEKPLKDFLLHDGFYAEVEHLNENCSSVDVFKKRFFEVFNAFKVVKFLNYVHEGFYDKIPVTQAAGMLLKKINIILPDVNDAHSLLLLFREMDNNSKGKQ